jgi:hypothetical protein
MTIGEYIKLTDIETYNKLKKLYRLNIDKPRKIELGDKPENLMKHDAYKRIGRRIRQIRWG